MDHTPVPCYDAHFGYYNNSDGCYYQLMSPQPARTDPSWAGHTGGAIWLATCLGVGGTGGGWLWLASPPPGAGPAGPTPGQLAAVAVAKMTLLGPRIGMAPRPGSTGLVGLPVWLWTAKSGRTWGPQTVTARVPGLSVTATARVMKLVWDMGNGGTVTCTDSGTPYTPAFGDASSPDCGYRYTVSSAGQPGGAYQVSVTATWRISWVGGGARGVLTQTRTSTASVRIGELQVLVT